VLGEHPSVGRVDGYFALCLLAQVGIAAALPSQYRAVFQYVGIVFEAGLVGHNFSVGIGANF
jgi:hypothetical protein